MAGSTLLRLAFTQVLAFGLYLTGNFGFNWLLNFGFVKSLIIGISSFGLSPVFASSLFLAFSIMYGSKVYNGLHGIYTLIKMRYFEGNQEELSSQIWQEFYSRQQSLTGNQQAYRDRYTQQLLNPIDFNALRKNDPERYQAFEAASTKLARFWRKYRDSEKAIPINPKGNHSDEFHTLINVDKAGKIDPRIVKSLTHTKDKKLLDIINKGLYTSDAFSNENSIETISSAFNLFASGRISQQQKTTVTNLVESSKAFGGHKAYAILNQDGTFSPEAKQILLPELRKFGHISGLLLPRWTVRYEEQFRILVKKLPLSEQYFFVHPNQKRTASGSSPYVDTRDFSSQLESSTKSIILLNKGYSTGLTKWLFSALGIDNLTYTHYSGVLTYATGCRDAMGLAMCGEEWEPLSPRIGHQTIEDIEHFSKQFARPTVSPESIALNIQSQTENIHSIKTGFPISYAHDEYHRTRRSVMNRNSQHAVERLIKISRETFGYRWSKDIWLLRDLDLGFVIRFAPGRILKSLYLILLSSALLKPILKSIAPNTYHTLEFSKVLEIIYLDNQVERCYPSVRSKFGFNHDFLLGYDNLPSQIMMLLILDMVLNADTWNTLNITANPNYFPKNYASLINMVQFLKEQDLFTKDDMKSNVIKLRAFMEQEWPHTDASASKVWRAPSDTRALLNKVAELKTELTQPLCDEYEVVRHNKSVFLGFVHKDKVKQEKSNPVDRLYGNDLRGLRF